MSTRFKIFKVSLCTILFALLGAHDLYAQDAVEDSPEPEISGELTPNTSTEGEAAAPDAREQEEEDPEPPAPSAERPDEEASDGEREPLGASEKKDEEADDSAEVSEEELRALGLAADADAAEIDEGKASEPSPPARPAASMLQSMNPDMALILDVAGAYFAGEPVQLGAHDPSQTGFNLQQLELHIESNVDPYFTFEANIVFAQFGVEVEEAYARTIAMPANLQLRAGQFLTRFGRMNPTHPHAWHFVDQPLVSGKFFGGEGSRGLGAEASWLTPLPWFAEVILSSTMSDGACCARSFFGAQNPGVERLGDLLYTARLEQFFSLTQSLSLLAGASAQFGPNPTGQRNRTEIYGGDLFLRYRPLNDPRRRSVSLQVEGMQRRRQVPDDVLVDQGLYTDLVVALSPRFEVGARYEQVSGIDAARADYLDPDWVGLARGVALQGTWYPSHFSRLRLQGSYDRPGSLADPTLAALLALEVLVGAHGSHSY